MEDIAEAMWQLEATGKLHGENLKENETFVSTLLEASRAAVRTHLKEKRKALRNAVLNSAQPGKPDDVISLIPGLRRSVHPDPPPGPGPALRSRGVVSAARSQEA